MNASPRTSFVTQRPSRTFTTNQPSVAGARPPSVSSSRASSITLPTIIEGSLLSLRLLEDLGKNSRIVLVAAAGPFCIGQPALRSLRQPQVRTLRCLENQIGVLLRKRERKTRRILAGFDRVAPALGLGSQCRRGEHVEGDLIRQAEPARQRKCFAEHADDADKRRIRDELRGTTRSDRSHVVDLTEDREQRAPALHELVVTANEDLQTPRFRLGDAAENRR